MVADKEYGLRSGTVNLPMAISMVKAIKQAVQGQKKQIVKLINCSIQAFHLVNIGFPGVKGK